MVVGNAAVSLTSIRFTTHEVADIIRISSQIIRGWVTRKYLVPANPGAIGAPGHLFSVGQLLGAAIASGLSREHLVTGKIIKHILAGCGAMSEAVLEHWLGGKPDAHTEEAYAKLRVVHPLFQAVPEHVPEPPETAKVLSYIDARFERIRNAVKAKLASLPADRLSAAGR
jgi:hypothetical protein